VPFTKLVIPYNPRLSVSMLDLLMLDTRPVFFQSQASSFEFRYQLPQR